MTDYSALAYRRFEWDYGAVDRYGDIERLLTFTGWSTIIDDRIVPIFQPAEHELLQPEVKVHPIAGFGANRRYRVPIRSIVHVAPARQMLASLTALMYELDNSQIVQTVNARVTKVAKTTLSNSDDINLILLNTVANPIPILKVSSAMDDTDLLTVGDGETHAQSIREMHDVALSRFAQALGIHTGDTVKKERLVADEVETERDPVDIIRINELTERVKIRDWLGIDVSEVIVHVGNITTIVD